MFLSTPAGGIKDFHVSGSWTQEMDGPLKKIKAAVWYHDFEGENIDLDMGTEFDALIQGTLVNGWTISAKYADYSGQGFKPDTQKLWITLGFKY